MVSFPIEPRERMEDVTTEDSYGHLGQRFSKCVTWGRFWKERRAGTLLSSITRGQHAIDWAIFPAWVFVRAALFWRQSAVLNCCCPRRCLRGCKTETGEGLWFLLLLLTPPLYSTIIAGWSRCRSANSGQSPVCALVWILSLAPFILGCCA